MDAIFANEGQENRICVNDGAGSFTCSDVSADANSSWTVALGPLDCGSGIDFVVANGGRNRVCLNDGMGSFSCSDVNDDTDATRDAALLDFDDDDDLDVVFVNNSTENELCLNDGSGALSCSDVSSDTNSSVGVAVGDLDGVNGVDIVVANYGEADRVCLNSGSGTFVCSNISADTFNSLRVALGDLDGTNGLDAVFAIDGQTNRVCMNDGAGLFSCSDLGSRQDFSYDVEIADLDGTNGPDALFANIGATNRVCLNNGSGVLACSDAGADVSSSSGVGLSDIDADGDLDAFFANIEEANQLCSNNGSASFTCVDISDDTNRTRGVALGVVGNSTSCAPTDLVAYWAADLSAKDLINDYDGILHGGATFAAGKAGSAFSFDGVDDQVTLTSFPAATNFTVEAWVYYVGTNTPPWATIFADSDHGLFLNDRRVCWYDLGNAFLGNTQVPAEEWHHVAITYDGIGGTFTGYVDGEVDGTSAFVGAALPPGMPNVSIGGHDGWDVLEGRIDELSVYDRVLSAHEIQAVYDLGCSGKCVPRDTTPDAFTFTDATGQPVGTIHRIGFDCRLRHRQPGDNLHRLLFEQQL